MTLFAVVYILLEQLNQRITFTNSYGNFKISTYLHTHHSIKQYTVGFI